jgi:hypothetical protein
MRARACACARVCVCVRARALCSQLSVSACACVCARVRVCVRVCVRARAWCTRAWSVHPAWTPPFPASTFSLPPLRPSTPSLQTHTYSFTHCLTHFLPPLLPSSGAAAAEHPRGAGPRRPLQGACSRARAHACHPLHFSLSPLSCVRACVRVRSPRSRSGVSVGVRQPRQSHAHAPACSLHATARDSATPALRDADDERFPPPPLPPLGRISGRVDAFRVICVSCRAHYANFGSLWRLAFRVVCVSCAKLAAIAPRASLSLSLSLSLIHPLLSPTGAPCRTRWRECDAPKLIGVRLHTAMGRRAPASSPSSPRLPPSSTMTFDSDIMQITISLRALIFASNPPQDGERAPGVPAAVAPSDLRPEDILAAMLRN